MRYLSCFKKLGSYCLYLIELGGNLSQKIILEQQLVCVIKVHIDYKLIVVHLLGKVVISHGQSYVGS